MIDESQEINRKHSKDSKEADGELSFNESDANKPQAQDEDIGTATAIAGSSSPDHPDTPYPYLIYNEKPSSDVERV